MHDYLVEIIFKSIALKDIGDLLRNLTASGAKIINYNLTCSKKAIDWSKQESISNVFLNNDNFGLFINISEFKKNNVCLNRCGIVVYKNGSSIDFELNFQFSDIKYYGTDALPTVLMELAKSIATEYHITNYFGGLEPAEDTKTRLFTNDQIGPFSI